MHRLDGEPVDAPLRPSSELPLHLAIYRATDAQVITFLRDRSAVIMGNHGAVTVADTLDRAHALAECLEYLCDVHLRALATGLPVRTSASEEIAAVGLRIAPDASRRPRGSPS